MPLLRFRCSLPSALGARRMGRAELLSVMLWFAPSVAGMNIDEGTGCLSIASACVPSNPERPSPK